MFPAVSNTKSSVWPMQPTGQVVVKLVRAEEGGISPITGKEQVRLVFYVQTQRGIVNGEDGQPAEFHHYVNKTLAPSSTARPIFEALLGRVLQEGEDGGQVVSQATGQKANGLMEVYVLKQGPNAGQQRNRIKSYWPLNGAMPAEATTVAAEDDQVIPF